ncbi:MAG: hypothetical protein ACRDSZ_05730 [Pseudonocardiaceae bacterium]
MATIESADGGLEELVESRLNRTSSSAIRAWAPLQLRRQAHHQRRQLRIPGRRLLGPGHNPDRTITRSLMHYGGAITYTP